ncbi:MAG TPA: HNH endonuclease signature motif containing protein [Gemmataceae bacterium]|nr:HNH endonuclease signature motif containing protein [Gemmataceae bacterium]
MAMTYKERPQFLKQTAEWFAATRRAAKAAGKFITYSLEDLQSLVERHFADSHCPYCQGQLGVGQFTLDHKTPIARGGKYIFKNIEVCCQQCRDLKGFLDGEEFRELLRLLQSWPKPVQNDFRARRGAGSGCPLPRLGSLEWFTGSAEAHAPLDFDKRHYKSVLLAQNGDSPAAAEELDP